jgi:hypothetical protein
MAELYAGQSWPSDGDELLRRSLAPRSPDLLLEAPGWLGLGGDQLALDAGCRDGRYAVELAARYGCRAFRSRSAGSCPSCTRWSGAITGSRRPVRPSTRYTRMKANVRRLRCCQAG